MVNKQYLLSFGFLLLIFQSCDSKSEDSNNTETPAVVIDSSAFTVKKTEVKTFKAVEDAEPSSAADVEKMASSEDLNALNTHQKFAQEFISASATKNYAKAAQYLAYVGADKARLGKDHFNFENINEQVVVKTTVDVIYNFLAESSDYEFISSKEGKNKKGEAVQVLEITFFKKGMGVNRRFFELKDTPNGMLISNMR